MPPFLPAQGEGVSINIEDFSKVIGMISSREQIHNGEMALPRAAKHGSTGTVDWHSVAHGVISRVRAMRSSQGHDESHTLCQTSEV